MKKKLVILFGIALIVLSIAVIMESLTFPGAVSAGKKTPGPSFFPILLSVVLIIAGIYQIAAGLKMPQGRASFQWSWGASNGVIIIFLLFLYVAVMEHLGYALSTLAFSILLMMRLKVRFFRAVAVSGLVVFFIVSIFGQVFHIQLPVGSLGLPW
ncbi:hypothetical protein MASR2M79_00380 [Aminivibrio sp.]